MYQKLDTWGITHTEVKNVEELSLRTCIEYFPNLSWEKSPIIINGVCRIVGNGRKCSSLGFLQMEVEFPNILPVESSRRDYKVILYFISNEKGRVELINSQLHPLLSKALQQVRSRWNLLNMVMKVSNDPCLQPGGAFPFVDLK